jgi:hypothetical protein
MRSILTCVAFVPLLAGCTADATRRAPAAASRDASGLPFQDAAMDKGGCSS